MQEKVFVMLLLARRAQLSNDLAIDILSYLAVNE